MAQYFSRITANHWTAKNRLEKAAHDVAKDMDRRLIPGDRMNAFIEEFKAKIDSINKANARCKPLELNIHKDYMNRDDIRFYISMVFNFTLFLVKE